MFSTDFLVTSVYQNLKLDMQTRRYFKANKSKSAFIFCEEPCARNYRIRPHGSLGSYRTFTEVDLEEIKRINRALDHRTHPENIDLQLLTCLFEGHSVFSLFQNEPLVFCEISD